MRRKRVRRNQCQILRGPSKYTDIDLQDILIKLSALIKEKPKASIRLEKGDV
jgi:hypothetical protein